MIEKQNRRKFVITLSCAAAAYGAIWTYRLLGFQSDSFTDILKFSGLIFFSSLAFSSLWWTLIRRRWTGWVSGALAGFLTAICIIPVPTLVGSIKTQMSLGQDFASAVPLAINYSISTFSLLEALAIPLSMTVGIWAARQT